MRRYLPVLLLLALPIPSHGQVPTPESFLGHKVGEDRKLAPWPRVVEYLRLVDAASDRVSIESAGKSTLGNDMPVVVLTSEANQANLERYREIARQLAQPDNLSAEQARALAAEGKTIALVTCAIHSTEVGSTQMAMEFVHDVATTQGMLDDGRNRILLGLEEAARFGDVVLYDPDLIGLILWYGRHVLDHQHRPIALEGDQLRPGSLLGSRAPEFDHLGLLWLAALQALNAAL